MGLFDRKEKPLPPLRVAPPSAAAPTTRAQTGGILLGLDTQWNPEALPNGHVCIIGASGSGKTQTLKAIAWELHQLYPNLQIVIVDFHGDQEIIGEAHYPIHMASEWGINPLTLNLDPEGGGPKIQAIAVAANLRKNLGIGPNQEGIVLEVLGECYRDRGITSDRSTWHREPPNFADFEQALYERATGGEKPDKEAEKIKLKLAATFTYGIFNRPNIPLSDRLIRVDLCKLPPEIGAIAAESLTKQLMDSHRLQGETKSKTPRTYLFIDEAKELSKSPALDRVTADGRKYGLSAVIASQSERHLSQDVIGNSATKIVLPVDQTEVAKVGKKFRFGENKIAQLQPLQALCRFGTEAKMTNIIPYYRRIEDEGDR